MNKRILRLALPNIISNITVPLLGLVDMAIVGHMGDGEVGSQVYIGAVTLGATIFNFIYWNMGFLRMGTSGFASQAYGRRDMAQSILVLARALVVALSVAVILIALQYPIYKMALYFIKIPTNVAPYNKQYFDILIWAAPSTLGLYVFKGWYIGMQNSKIPMFIAILINVANIVFSLFFVLVLDMKVIGVALGTILAQYCGLLLAILFFFKTNYRKLLKKLDYKKIMDIAELREFFKVNGNIFLRTLCLVIVFTFFSSASAKGGETLLAANMMLMQLFTLFSYIMDGFAYAGESLVGRFVGSRNLPMLKSVIRHLLMWGMILSSFFTVLYFVGGNAFLSLLTDSDEVLNVASKFFYWVLPVPIVGFSAFLWDGIFVGASASKEMRNAMFVATSVFFILYYSLVASWGINALWLAFLSFLLLRGILQHIQVKTAVYKKI